MAFWISGNILLLGTRGLLRLHALKQPAQGVDQARTGIAQLGPVYDREAPQHRFSWHRQSHSYLAPVGHAAHSFDQASLLQPVDQPDRAMVADQEVIGNLPDGGPPRLRQGARCQQQLVLLRFQPFLAGGPLAKVKEIPDLIAKLTERGIVFRRQGSRLLSHIYIVSRYDGFMISVPRGFRFGRSLIGELGR
jgi:hypothetical protein